MNSLQNRTWIATLVAVLTVTWCTGTIAVMANDQNPESVDHQSIKIKELLLSDLRHFFLTVYVASGDSPHKQIALSVEPLSDTNRCTQALPAEDTALISTAEATRLIETLCDDRFFYRVTMNSSKQLSCPPGPYVMISAGNGSEMYTERLALTRKPYRWHYMLRPPVLAQVQVLAKTVRSKKASLVLDSLMEKMEIILGRSKN